MNRLHLFAVTVGLTCCELAQATPILASVDQSLPLSGFSSGVGISGDTPTGPNAISYAQTFTAGLTGRLDFLSLSVWGNDAPWCFGPGFVCPQRDLNVAIHKVANALTPTGLLVADVALPIAVFPPDPAAGTDDFVRVDLRAFDIQVAPGDTYSFVLSTEGFYQASHEESWDPTFAGCAPGMGNPASSCLGDRYAGGELFIQCYCYNDDQWRRLAATNFGAFPDLAHADINFETFVGVSQVPEPELVSLLAAGLLALSIRRRRGNRV